MPTALFDLPPEQRPENRRRAAEPLPLWAQQAAAAARSEAFFEDLELALAAQAAPGTPPQWQAAA